MLNERLRTVDGDPALRLPSLLVVNAGLVGLAFGVGWFAAGIEGGRLGLDEGPPEPANASVLADGLDIVAANLRAVAVMVLGAVCTGGVFAHAVLVWNGYGLGSGLSALSRGAPEVVDLALRYVPLEFAALVLAATAAQGLAAAALRSLWGDQPLRIRGVPTTFAAAFVLLVSAAFIEADVKQLLSLDGSLAGVE